MSTVYFDESGNTGANLLDPAQPTFALVSNNLSDEEARILIEELKCSSPLEAHFARLRRRPAGRDGIVRLLTSNLLNEQKVKASVFHKRYMVVTKIVDTLVENLAFRAGFDLYRDGQNIALSNLLYFCLPAFCGQDLFDRICLGFTQLIRKRTTIDIDLFYNLVEEAVEVSKSEGFKSDLEMILITRQFIGDILSQNDRFSLDPSIPAFFEHCNHWGGGFPQGFKAIHDDSKTVESQREIFALLADLTQDDVRISYDRRTFVLPLKINDLSFSNSQNYLQLQVSDIIASSINYWATALSKGEDNDEFFLALNELNLVRFIQNSVIWPSKDVSPDDLGTKHAGGLHPANHTGQFLYKAMS